MANVKFSKNGVPIGRNKTTADNNSSRWTPEEDNYLRIALKEGLSCADVSSRLGRSAASIQTRKFNLGLDGRFTRSSNGKTSSFKRTKRSRLESYNPPSGIQLFQLESGIPVPSRTGRNEEALQKIREIFNDMKIGQSFVIPKDLRNSTYYLAKKEFIAYKLRISPTSTDRKFFRIFRIA